TVNTESGWHSVIGKVHTVYRSDVFQTLDAVSRAGFGPEAEFATPRPLAYLHALHVLLEERVPGRVAMDVFVNGTPEERLAAAERSARWLARFHAAAPRLGDSADVGEEVPRFGQWRDEIASLGKPFAAKAERLSLKLHAGAPSAGSTEP